MNKFIVLILLAVCALVGCDQRSSPKDTATIQLSLKSDDQRMAEAFAKQISDIWVESKGTIEKILPDDREGSAHQRLIVRLSTGQTILLSHNIDLAPRIPNPQIGSEISFRGEYEWNSKGGVVHWTHHDPSGHKSGGLIEYKGKIYK